MTYSPRHVARFGGRLRVPDIAEVPGGRLVELAGRGRTYVVDIPGRDIAIRTG
ncbi:hypothetical protein [Nocardia amamiensis]|uniref:hypothetical protein n=1 Tax=Nocardia amamiensis TaxID=404578 RepID=UPI001E40F4A6|nr:hypothetical protein [Nocardia amamiensis]